jgi:hypothetical protein
MRREQLLEAARSQLLERLDAELDCCDIHISA